MRYGAGGLTVGSGYGGLTTMSGATAMGSGVGKDAAPLERLQAQLDWLCRKGGGRVFEFLKNVAPHTKLALYTVFVLIHESVDSYQPACVTFKERCGCYPRCRNKARKICDESLFCMFRTFCSSHNSDKFLALLRAAVIRLLHA